MIQQLSFHQANYLLAESSGSPSGAYTAMLWYRRTVITMSCIALGWNIAVIIKNRQYVFTTLKLFMFIEIFSLIAIAVVLPHDPAITLNIAQLESGGDLSDRLNRLIQEMNSDSWSLVICSLQAWINLTAYNISYFFGVLLTLNVRKVLDNTHKNFMKQNIKMIIVFCTAITLVYLIPLLFAFNDQMLYSYGPAGFVLLSSWFYGDYANFSMFYCGLCPREDSLTSKVMSSFHMIALPVFMFFIHGYLLWINERSLRGMKQLEEINPRHWFIIKTGRLSSFLFLIQFLNFVKFIILQFEEALGGQNNGYIIIIMLLNLVFDWLPLLLVIVYYKKYYKKANTYRQGREMNNTDSLITNEEIWARLKNEQS